MHSRKVIDVYLKNLNNPNSEKEKRVEATAELIKQYHYARAEDMDMRSEELLNTFINNLHHEKAIMRYEAYKTLSELSELSEKSGDMNRILFPHLQKVFAMEAKEILIHDHEIIPELAGTCTDYLTIKLNMF